MSEVPKIESEIQKLNPSAIIELFELDTRNYTGGTILRFHAGTNELKTPVIWQGNTYSPLPIEITGFEWRSTGSIPRPKARVANVTGLLSATLQSMDDLIGSKVTRIRTFVKYLDSANFKKLNLLKYSNNTQSTVYFTNQVTTGANNEVTVTTITDPYIGQQVTGLGSIQNRTFSFGVKASTTTAVGKYLRLFIYSSSVNEVYSVQVGPLTSTPTLYTTSYKFLTSTDTSINFRVDMEGSSAWVANTSKVTLSEWQANEGTTLNTYQEIDAEHNPFADPSAEFTRDVFFINQKTMENKYYIEFELAAMLDVQGIKLPRRMYIANVCPWLYRGTECGYTGAAVANENDELTADISKDACGKRIDSCNLRFPNNNSGAGLPYGGFPGVAIVRY